MLVNIFCIIIVLVMFCRPVEQIDWINRQYTRLTIKFRSLCKHFRLYVAVINIAIGGNYALTIRYCFFTNDSINFGLQTLDHYNYFPSLKILTI